MLKQKRLSCSESRFIVSMFTVARAVFSTRATVGTADTLLPFFLRTDNVEHRTAEDNHQDKSYQKICHLPARSSFLVDGFCLHLSVCSDTQQNQNQGKEQDKQTTTDGGSDAQSCRRSYQGTDGIDQIADRITDCQL